MKILPSNIRRAFWLYLCAIVGFTLFRVLLFVNELDKLGDATTGQILYAFLMGLNFDFVSATYFLVLPIVLLSIETFMGKRCEVFEKIIIWITTILLSIAFLCCGADIPYFHQFFERFNIAAFQWMDGEEGFMFVVKMIIEEPSYWLAAIPVIIIAVILFFVVRRIISRSEADSKGHIIIKIISFIVLVGVVFIGIHGRFDTKSPIRVGTAYFCNNNFLNQLGLNPNFTFIQSWIEKNSAKGQKYKFMDSAEALANVQKALNINEINPEKPLARQIHYDSLPNNYNVIVVIMESHSADKMSRHGNTKNLTPFFDSLSTEGLYYTNCYTAGTHTYCGIFGTTCSYPVVYRQHPLKHTPITLYDGLATTLKNKGYSTMFFVPHDSQFDNMEGFLLKNEFERVVSKRDYPAEAAKTTLGVPDDYMFSYSLPLLDELYAQGKPFCATYLTASDHGPYYIPDYFEGHSDAANDLIVEYADWAKAKFMKEASRHAWYDKTIFAFVADHGNTADATYPVSLSFIHSPMLFYCKDLIEPRCDSVMAGQIDLFPTLMGLLNLNYTNNTMGIDLRNETRPYIFSFADDKYAVIDSEWLLIVDYNNPNPVQLFRYQEKSLEDYAERESARVKAMRTYAESHFQVFQDLY